ncbi:sulfurtransferase [Plantactinospora sp. GCM10030261]|uniref:sulfurtransferase n=1 Tax=Plantactinospora sp. GCM10030261 TaxID=3273420 RepID=UPI00360D9639
MSGTGSDDLLVTPVDLADRLSSERPPTLLDVRWRLTVSRDADRVGPTGRDDYQAGHLPGAVFLDLDHDLCGPPGPAGRHPLPDPTELQRVLRAAGVAGNRPVVVYDDGDGLAASRAWWTLRWAGHPAVRVLDGGYPAWLAAGLPVTAELPDPAPGDLTVRPGALPVLDAEGAAALAAGDGVLVDVRAAARFRGETEPIDAVAGHVPGAVNLPIGELLDAGRFREPAALRSRFAAVGVDPGVRVGAYCGSGVTAAQAVFALHRAGRPDAALYVGSWSGWITDPSRPVATGIEQGAAG